jgi:hypothetical protein
MMLRWAFDVSLDRIPVRRAHPERILPFRHAKVIPGSPNHRDELAFNT